MRLALFGCIGGIAGSLALMRAIQFLLFGVGPVDPFPLTVSTALAVGVMLLASWLPAHRARTVDPIAALRSVQQVNILAESLCGSRARRVCQTLLFTFLRYVPRHLTSPANFHSTPGMQAS